MPEQSVQAGIEVKGQLLMPIHSGVFKLAVHKWTDPIQRFKASRANQNVPMVHPFIGERFCLGIDVPQQEWWLTTNSK